MLRKIREDQASVILIAPWWPARSWFQDLLALLVGTPCSLPCRPDLVSQPLSGFRHLSPETLHLTAWLVSGRGPIHRVFSERAAQFLVQSRRESTRVVYNSRLEAFHTWCEEVGVSPRGASLPSFADFLISLFDKGRSLSTIRSYRSAVAAVHSGFADGSSVFSASQIAALLKSFSLKRPSFKPLDQHGVFPRCWLLWLVLPSSLYALRRFCLLRSDGLSHGDCFWSTKELFSRSFSRTGAYSFGRSGCSFDS